VRSRGLRASNWVIATGEHDSLVDESRRLISIFAEKAFRRRGNLARSVRPRLAVLARTPPALRLIRDSGAYGATRRPRARRDGGRGVGAGDRTRFRSTRAPPEIRTSAADAGRGPGERRRKSTNRLSSAKREASGRL
jgi:hypothetical protein